MAYDENKDLREYALEARSRLRILYKDADLSLTILPSDKKGWTVVAVDGEANIVLGYEARPDPSDSIGYGETIAQGIKDLLEKHPGAAWWVK